MSDLARLFPAKQPGASPQPQTARTNPKSKAAWFAWWVAACLVTLAFSTYRQLEIQRRLLVSSRDLERIVAQSRTVSGEMVEQLQQIRALDTATSRLDAKLARLAQINGEIRQEVAGLESTAGALLHSVAAMDGQAGQSQALLARVASESAALHATLLRSQEVGDRLTARLAGLVEAQEAINADLAEMTAKTQFLDRIVRGERP